MSRQNFLNSLGNFIFLCMNFITESFSISRSNSSDSSNSSVVSELPLSVIIEILVKLPINGIIRSRCVCKSWHNLIIDPYFANIYFKCHPYTAIALSQHRIDGNRLNEGSFYFLEIGSDGDVMRTPFNAKSLDFTRRGILGITGSCNGLLCLVQSPQLENPSDVKMYNNQTVYIINPLLGEIIMLPQVNLAKNVANVVYGLGFSTYSDHYKVLRIVSCYVYFGICSYERKAHGEIFTIGVDNKWRSLKESNFPFLLFPCGINLNGVLHTIADDWTSGFIYAFDIEEEKGHRIMIPSGLGDNPANIVLALWDNKLCFADNGSEFQVDVWTMKQYGVVESWSKDIILKRRIPSDLRAYRFIPVTTLRNGDLIMSLQNEGDLRIDRPNHLILFNPKSRTCTKFEVFVEGWTVSFLFGYSPSLFSIKNVANV